MQRVSVDYQAYKPTLKITTELEVEAATSAGKDAKEIYMPEALSRTNTWV
jgi:hypothetical protein